MRLNGIWKIASLLSAVMLFASSDLCMLLVCVPGAPQALAHGVAPRNCDESRSAHGDHPEPGHDACAMPCSIVVTLAAGPQLPPPQATSPAMPPAVLAPATEIVAVVRNPRGPEQPGHGPALPIPPYLDATGVRAPPTA